MKEFVNRKAYHMKFVNRFLSIIILISISSCTAIPELSTYPSKEIIIAYGPEDIVLDSISGNTDRLLVSCCSRRKDDSSLGNGVYALNFESENVKELIRENEPKDLKFHPHGFDLAIIDKQAYLYIINHEDNIDRQSILVYHVYENKLVFIEMIEHDLIISPNDIFVNNGGDFYISNDAGERGNQMEILLGQKKGSVVYFPLDHSPIIAAPELGYANGVYYNNGYLYVSTVSEKKLYRYKKENQEFTDKICLASGLKGGDNLNPYQGGLLIPTHPNFIAFLRHKGNTDIISPSVIYHYKYGVEKAEVLFSDDGNRISAASTALVYKDKIYISQIFDDFILVVDLDD